MTRDTHVIGGFLERSLERDSELVCEEKLL